MNRPYIEPDALLGEARRIAGADDFGGDGFEEAFDRFVTALNAEADLTPLGVERTRSHIRKLLVGRLVLFRDRQRYPAIAREVVRAPLVITGQARSGTSYLNELLAADPRNYALRHWQVWSLSPPPGLPGVDTAPARAAGERYIRFEGWQDPEVRTTHNYTSDGVAEDILIQDYSFRMTTFSFFWNVPSYAQWLYGADIGPAYRIQHKIMQALQHGHRRDQWVTKGPMHLTYLSDMFAVFPDARMIVTHRDPVKALASVISMLKAHRGQFGNAPETFGRDFMLAVMEGTAAGLRGMISRRRDPAVDARFADVPYLGLERDPLGEVAKVYAHHGVEFTAPARAAMQAHIDTNRKGKFGRHRYDIRDLGVSVEEVRETFRFYTDEYDVPLEA